MKKSIATLIKKFSLLLHRTPSRPIKSTPTTLLSEDLAQIGLTLDQWYARRCQSSRLYGVVSQRSVTQWKEKSPRLILSTIIKAERIIQHRFHLLGCEIYHPVDPDRDPWPQGYQPIDWYLDPVQNLRFPVGIPHQEWNLYKMRPGNADIKFPWELGRCQHWIVLAQAYKITGDFRYVEEIKNQLRDFMQVNPIGIGVNWTCTMDVAIRAANWAIALEWIQDCSLLEFDFWREAYEALFAHGVFIFQHLENKYEVTSNHFLSNVAGLHFLGRVFADVPQGETWEWFCREHFEKEISVQVYEEGADFESSVPYHRLVTELFLAGARLAEWQKKPLSSSYQEKLHRMVDFLYTVLRPDGKMPQVGDADDGRLHLFSDYGDDPQSPLHLFGPAGRFFNETRWLQAAGETGSWEAVWWGYPYAASRAKVSLEKASKLFPQSGLAVVRHNNHYLLITNGKVGTQGFGNHKHNELLSFELHLDQIPLIVDPGSYVYTSDFDARNQFRSTRYHNTICIDREEQNELQPDWIFRLFEKAHPEHLGCIEENGEWIYKGFHKGYTRLDHPVVHKRGFLFRPDDSLVVIQDVLEGQGTHNLQWHFHLHPGVKARQYDASSLEIKQDSHRFTLLFPSELQVDITDAFYSPSYGIKIPCQAIDLHVDCELNNQAVFCFALGQYEWFQVSDNMQRVLTMQQRIDLAS